MFHLAFSLILGVGASPAPPVAAGSIRGTVILLSERGRAKNDASEVVVWLEGTHAASRTKGAPAPRMISNHKRFIPRVIAVESGDSVEFPNEDPIFHNVFSVSGENRFDLGLYRKGKSKERAFLAAGLVRVYCNIHPQMVGYVRVIDSSYHVVTKADGAFSFDGVPAGARTVKAWSEKAGESSIVAQVQPGRFSEVTLSMEVGSYEPETHKNKYGQDYPPPPADEERY